MKKFVILGGVVITSIILGLVLPDAWFPFQMLCSWHLIVIIGTIIAWDSKFWKVRGVQFRFAEDEQANQFAQHQQEEYVNQSARYAVE